MLFFLTMAHLIIGMTTTKRYFSLLQKYKKTNDPLEKSEMNKHLCIYERSIYITDIGLAIILITLI